MAVYRYPPEVHELVKKYAPVMRDQELAEKCNQELGTQFTANKMKQFRGNHGYRNFQKQLSSEEYWKYQTKWPKGMFEFIRDNSWGVSSKDMAQMVNEKFGTDFNQHRMKCFRAKYGIKSGVTGWYQKGHPPGTKGKTIEEICKHDPEKLARVRATQFKKGDRPVNEMPIGTVTVAGNGYKVRKVSMTGSQWERWELLHRAVWEEHNGPIPEGMAVTFRDGDKMNCDISNLMLISRGEAAAMARKGLWSEDPELSETALAMVRLQIEANKIRERRRNERKCSK